MELRSRKRGQKDSNLRAFYRLWFSRPAHSSALPCPLTRSCGVDYTISGQNIYRREHRRRRDGAQCSCVGTGWKRHEARDEKEVARTCQRAHPSCGGFACSGRVVRGERPLSSSACLSARDREAEEVGSHDDLHPYSGYVHPYLPTRAGGWLADGIARSDLDVGVVRRRTQTPVDGRPTLALRGNLPGYGVARCDRRLCNLPDDTPRRDSLDPRRRPRL